jgi:hypothetical protein
MVRHLTTLVLGGILGSMVLVGNAEACHRKKCCHVVCVVPPVCVKPVCPPPVPCVQTVAYCPPPVKCCKIKLCLPKFCHKKVYCPPPVVVACATPVYYGAPVGSPQASGQR